MSETEIGAADLRAAKPSNPQPSEWANQETLDALVTGVATRFMDASSETLTSALTDSLQAIAEFFSMDTAFLRSNDLKREMSVLDAEWPPRHDVPDPDPLGEVPFAADPVFGATRDLTEPYVARPSTSTDDYQARVKTGSGVDGVAMAMVPLMRNHETVGVLGFIKFGDREWVTAELNALQAIASLIVQLQARVDAEQRLQFHAYHDDLTGLPNRRALIDELDNRIVDKNKPTTLFFLDIDRFKSVNGFLGHTAGDDLLREVAKRLQALVRKGDMVARLAGDEFIMVLADVFERSEIDAIAERVLEALRQPISIGENQIIRTVSLGIAASDPSMRTSDELVRNADAATRQAKAAGGDRSCLFDQEMRLAEDQRSAIEIGLRRAIDHGELMLYYQPEIDLNTGELKGLEALVRWNHPERGVLAAGQFIEVAEETGLVVDLGIWVVEEAIRQMAEWRNTLDHADFVMRVNLSPAQLSTVNIVEFVAACLGKYDLPGHLICFEITEHALMQNTEQSIQILHSLRLLGITLAIDDFGTGYSSMTQLKNLPLDILKIDQTFVAGLGESSTDQAIVEASVHLARSFGLDIVAEGIETAEMMDRLVDLGCERGQGYLIKRPVSAADLQQILERGRMDLELLRHTVF